MRQLCFLYSVSIEKNHLINLTRQKSLTQNILKNSFLSKGIFSSLIAYCTIMAISLLAIFTFNIFTTDFADIQERTDYNSKKRKDIRALNHIKRISKKALGRIHANHMYTTISK